MQRLSALFLLAIGLSPSAHAQLDSTDQQVVRQVAFQLTKATVEFLATDKQTYGYLAKTTCETCNDYPSLVQFIKASKLTKADELVRDAQKQVATITTPTATAEQVVTGLQQFLNDRVTKGDGRERRKNLASYKTYTAQVAQVLAGAGVTATGVAPDPAGQTADVLADTLETGETVASLSSATRAEAGLFSYGGIALLLSLLNLAGLIYLWSQRRSKSTSTGRSSLLAELGELSDRVSVLERERKESMNRATKTEPRPGSPAVETRRQDPMPTKPAPATLGPILAKPVQPAPVTPSAAQTPAPAPAPVQSAPQPASQGQTSIPINQPRRRDVALYGRTADLGDGFSVASLLNAPDRDTVFQIEVKTDSQAVYRVTEEPGAQQLALSDPYSYLADACEYLAKPIPNARIRTNQPGQLALQGDKWKIIEKAKISFY